MSINPDTAYYACKVGAQGVFHNCSEAYRSCSEAYLTVSSVATVIIVALGGMSASLSGPREGAEG